MRQFLYRINYDGFIDWLHDYNKVRRIIIAWESSTYGPYKEDNREAYSEALKWYKDYLIYIKLLKDNERAFVEAVIRHHVPEIHGGGNLAYEKWKYGIVNSGKYSPKEISNEEVGKAITESREFRCLSRTQVAGILGISYNTLKMYETGKRSLPFPTFYKLSQLLEIDVGMLKIGIK